MPKTTYYEGQMFSAPGKPDLVYSKGRFYPVGSPEAAAATGSVATAAADMPAAALTPGSDSRTRVVLGLGPAVEAQRGMLGAEKGGNPFDTREGTYARALEDRVQQNIETKKTGIGLSEWLMNPIVGDGSGNPLKAFSGDNDVSGLGLLTAPNAKLEQAAKRVGGPRYAGYVQAAKSFESAFLPILSGAAVTESEAARQIKAALPAPGDSPAILAQKAKQRAMMINGAADLAGRPRPFPDVGTIDFKGGAPATEPKPAPKSYRDAKPPAGKAGGDGFFYIEDPNKPGSFPRITRDPRGRWVIRSANGKMLEVY